MTLSTKRRSIQTRFTYGLGIVVGSIFIVISVSFIVFNKSSLEKELHADLDTMAQLSVSGLSTALWQYNYDYVEDYLTALFHYQDLVYVSVHSGEKLISKKVRHGLDRTNVAHFTSSDDSIVKEADILHHGVVIGTIHLAVSRERIDALTVRNSLLAMFFLAIIVSAIAVTIFLLSSKYLFTPLARLEHSIRAISSGRLDTEIDTGSGDEIGHLAQVFDQMIKKLLSTMASRDELEAEVIERRRMEEALRESEKFLDTIVENIPNMIFVKEATDLRFVRFNKAGEDLLGISRETMLERNDYDFFPKEQADFFTKKDRNVLEKGTVLDIMEEPIQTQNKGQRVLHTKKIPILDNNGNPLYLLGISEDITDRKKYEEQLRQTQKMESIGSLAGGIAHDFNNILFPIVGMAEMLLEDLSPESLEYENAQEILKAGNRGSELVKQILAFSRQSEHKKIPTRIQPVLKEVLKLSRSTIPSNIDINQDIQADCGLIMADPTQIHQVAMNMITNAYHAVEANGGKISIHLKETDLDVSDLPDPNLEPGKYVLFSISDTGHGIPPAITDKIFNPYFSTKEQGKGTGLGLAVVHGIVQEHKGAIEVDSEWGKGATFNIYLPLMDQTDSVEPLDATDEIPQGNERILLVDDEEAVVKLVKQMLERLGYHVTERNSSIDALKVFKANQDAFDVVITDMTMPNMTGDRFAREILAIRPSIPIVVCTGFSERINTKKAKSLGVKGFLMKPIVKSELAKTVRKVLDEVKNKTH